MYTNLVLISDNTPPFLPDQRRLPNVTYNVNVTLHNMVTDQTIEDRNMVRGEHKLNLEMTDLPWDKANKRGALSM